MWHARLPTSPVRGFTPLSHVGLSGCCLHGLYIYVLIDMLVHCVCVFMFPNQSDAVQGCSDSSEAVR